MFALKKEEFIWNLINGKRVALIGPSPHLQNKNLGKFIDDFEVVCRVGELYPSECENDYGSRTDLFFGCFNSYTPPQLESEFLRIKDKKLILNNLKCCISPQFRYDARGKTTTEESFFKVSFFKNSVIPFFNVNDEFYHNVSSMVGAQPITGLMSVTFLTQYNPKELFITGMTFYNQGLTSDVCYKKGYLGITNKYNPTGHPRQPQIDFFKKFILTSYSSFVKIDSVLKDVLNVNYQNVVKI